MNSASKKPEGQLATKEYLKWLWVTLAALVIAAVFIMSVLLDVNRSKSVQNEQNIKTMMQIKTQIETSIVSRLNLTRGMSAYLQLHQTIEPEKLDPFLSILIDHKDPVFRNVAVLRGTTIRYQYPLLGNEKTIGVDLLTIPEQVPAIAETMATLKQTLSAPVELVQGGSGVVIRVPIATTKGDPTTYWGMISMVLDYDALMKEVFTEVFLADYNISLNAINSNGQPQKIIYSSGQLSSFQMSYDMPVLSEVWRITISPKKVVTLPVSSYILILIGFSTVTLVVYQMTRSMNRRTALNLEVTQRTKELRATNELLEQYVAEFEEKQAELEMVNGQLADSLQDLQETQQQLVLTEKLAALGDLVASLAHEINTPLGVCVTLYSYIEENLTHFKRLYLDEAQPLQRDALVRMVEDNKEALMLMGHNLKRSSELVASFKLVSMDQYLEEYRIVDLAHYIDEIINSLRPKYKKIDSMLVLEVDPEIRLYTYPGAISQILTNLINNSIIHGFDGVQEGRIELKVKASKPGFVRFDYTDNGVGLTAESAEKIFTPFFTTKKNKGSSGLGMHILYNAVVKTLGGEIELLDLVKGFGVSFEIPVQVEKDSETFES